MMKKKIRVSIFFVLILAFLSVFGVYLVDASIAAFTPASPSNDTWTNITSTVFTFTPVSTNNVTNITCEVFVNDVATGVNTTVLNNTATVMTANATLTEGYNLPWYVNCSESGANNETKSGIMNISIDATAPSINFDPLMNLNNTWFNTTTPEFLFNLTDNLDATSNWTIYVNGTSNVSNSSANNTQTSYNISGLGNGKTYNITIQSLDEAVNVLNSTLNISIDTGNPTAMINITNESRYNDTTPELFINITDALANRVNWSIYINGTLNQSNSTTNNTVTSVNLTTLAEGKYAIHVNGRDQANNSVNSSYWTIHIDTTNPTSSSGTPTGTTADNTPTLTVTSSEAASCKGTIDADESFAAMDFSFLGGGTVSHTYTSGVLTDAAHTVYVRCRDVAGNIATASDSYTFTVDTSSNTGSGSGGGGGGGGSRRTTEPTPEVVEPIQKSPEPTVVEEGETAEVGDVATTKYVQVASGGSVEFTFNAEAHTLEVTEVTETTATVIISSDPIELTLTVGETREVEIDGEMLTVTLNSIVDGKADISFGAVTEPVVEEEQPSLLWLWILILLVVIGVVYYFGIQKRGSGTKKRR